LQLSQFHIKTPLFASIAGPLILDKKARLVLNGEARWQFRT